MYVLGRQPILEENSQKSRRSWHAAAPLYSVCSCGWNFWKSVSAGQCTEIRMSNLSIEFRVNGIKVFAVQIILDNPEGFAETLEMDDFPLSQKPDRVNNVRIIDHAQDVVIGSAGFLLCCDLVRTT